MIAGAGLVGWQMLQSTMQSQRSTFDQSAEIARETTYFKEKIGTISSAEELVDDRRLLSVALAAFGMSDEIDSKYLIQRIIEEGADDNNSIANKLGDSRYITLAQAFDFQEITNYKTEEAGFGDPIFAAYEERMMVELEETLASPEYANDPVSSVLFRLQVESNISEQRDHFLTNIASVKSVEDLLDNYDLKSVVLKAFDLEDRANSTTLLKRVLSENPAKTGALSTVLGDPNMVALAETFAFYDVETKTVLETENFAENIVNEYKWQQFKSAVDEVDSSIGAALQFQKSIPDLSSSGISENAKWYSVLGSTVMREVFETALGLPSGFSQIDIDKQLEIIKEKADQRFGISTFSDLENENSMNKIIHGYLLQDQLAQGSAFGSQHIAMTLLSTIRYDN
ncbi:flagellar protein [Salipiger aestuarii]|uniref:DUF1217 domain-containing protein n=1 Tax=Salipiger aestuarii TaxID=568098 RepID=UPI00123B367B|nr:DUF1217 domain-containing protein [Salipiger aestuarii]KAA8606728.1 flagellar protein [Salipiger aestuarii]KAA8610612.1 flagellar protein [Salipiger aestuarii]